ncbi:Uncharacterized protein PHPALM_18258 [Phytophthora palmivora]|uniref:Integrase catalytic domain-containing protein n=1 Tax=Phytophthora palmivora TaxID=4796 RepID=A0A2P4XK65_9STRA|nr:Uncharacterized protein PHPALM_18258 [Phytophthora palmivora]
MDASDHAIGGTLFQTEGRENKVLERPIAFGGREYKDAEKNYSIREKELSAILFGLRLRRMCLLDKPFVVETDHKSLETIFSQNTILRGIARWYDELREYPITFRYIQGKTNTVADGISRRPDFVGDSTITLTSITTHKKVDEHIEHGIASLMRETTDRYCDDPFTSALERILNKTETFDKTQIRHIERYSRQSKQILYQAPSDNQTRLVLPSIPEIIEALLYEFHDSKCYGHPGVEHRDSKFTSEIWTNLCGMLGTHQKLTTAFWQQANGVTERVNLTIQNYLRAFSNSNSDDWDEFISLAEFVYNSRHQASIGMPPFQADIGYVPATPATIYRNTNTDLTTDRLLPS